MKKLKYITVLIFFITIVSLLAAFKKDKDENNYALNYMNKLADFKLRQDVLLQQIQKSDLAAAADLEKIKEQINLVRTSLKSMDFWFRYLEPVSYKKMNGPLPVEWETEVFEKFEKPYKREGAGLTLAALYLEEPNLKKDSLLNLIRSSVIAAKAFEADSVTSELKTYHHFFLCNRLFLLNLAAIYTTGFECPDTSRIIPELRLMLSDVYTSYLSFNESFPTTTVSENYLALYKEAITFVNTQPANYKQFDHFIFIKKYINPLFALNQELIRQYKVVSKSYVDYTLNKNSSSIFSKTLYNGQNAKGIFLRVYDRQVLAEIENIGKLLFYDPILSGNNLRSCASCHKPGEYYTDTLNTTALHFDRRQSLPRNSPSLINAPYNHLLMLDGKHISLQDQTKAVITNPIELGCNETEILKKVLSCADYKTAFKSFLKYTPQEKEISLEHILSAITLYYSKFSTYYSPFDNAMNLNTPLNATAQKGFNLFMGKAQCATCHFVPQFNGVKPPYVSSEFEVLGVPKDTSYLLLSADKGRFEINPAIETANAFRTGTLKNIEKTKPYMHNGVFKNLDEVINFYDAGGGAGHGLKVENQTLSSDSLHLTVADKKNLVSFLSALTETFETEKTPEKLPVSKIKKLNTRKPGGDY